jgi:hypothetical protein
MESCVGFTPEYLHTLQIIWRSTACLSLARHKSMIPLTNRVLLACIRNLGGCPCPRCTIPLSDAYLVGTKRDWAKRISMAQIDDNNLKFKVSRARDLMYQDNYAVDSAGVEQLLKPLSLVPTKVSQPVHQWYHWLMLASRAHSRISCQSFRITYLRCSWLT